MRSVSIVGIGQTPVERASQRSLAELAVASLCSAMQDAGLERVPALYASSMLAGLLLKQENTAALIAEGAGLTGIEALRIEAAAGSGGAALHTAVTAVAAGIFDVVAVTGVERMSAHELPDVLAALATAAESGTESVQGLTFAGINALIMRRYMYEYSWQHDDFAAFTINAHSNAAGNAGAIFRQPVTIEQYRQARLIADPINLLDCAPICDGAATVILAATEMAGAGQARAVRVSGSAVATDTVSLHGRADVLWLEAVYRSAKSAYEQAGREPQDVDLFELHDAFSIMAALSLEGSGFAGKGDALRLAQDGNISLTGSIPICTMGGLKAHGHPVGASGIYQAVEATLQLRAQAGVNQVDGARVAMTQSIGGSGACVATHLLEV